MAVSCRLSLAEARSKHLDPNALQNHSAESMPSLDQAFSAFSANPPGEVYTANIGGDFKRVVQLGSPYIRSIEMAFEAGAIDSHAQRLQAYLAMEMLTLALENTGEILEANAQLDRMVRIMEQHLANTNSFGPGIKETFLRELSWALAKRARTNGLLGRMASSTTDHTQAIALSLSDYTPPFTRLRRHLDATSAEIDLRDVKQATDHLTKAKGLLSETEKDPSRVSKRFTPALRLQIQLEEARLQCLKGNAENGIEMLLELQAQVTQDSSLNPFEKESISTSTVVALGDCYFGNSQFKESRVTFGMLEPVEPISPLAVQNQMKALIGVARSLTIQEMQRPEPSIDILGKAHMILSKLENDILKGTHIAKKNDFLLAKVREAISEHWLLRSTAKNQSDAVQQSWGPLLLALQYYDEQRATPNSEPDLLQADRQSAFEKLASVRPHLKATSATEAQQSLEDFAKVALGRHPWDKDAKLFATKPTLIADLMNRVGRFGAVVELIARPSVTLTSAQELTAPTQKEYDLLVIHGFKPESNAYKIDLITLGDKNALDATLRRRIGPESSKQFFDQVWGKYLKATQKSSPSEIIVILDPSSPQIDVSAVAIPLDGSAKSTLKLGQMWPVKQLRSPLDLFRPSTSRSQP